MNIRGKIISYSVHKLALPFLRQFIPAGKIPFSMDELHLMRAGSLGKSFAEFITNNGLELLPYFETHDLKHVLLGYGSTACDEACLQFFYLGNRHYSVATIFSSVFSCMLLPEYFFKYLAAYRRGTKAKRIGKIPLECLVFHPVCQLRNQFSIH
jgi:ubiquinone biosynthesis protein Coq4